MIDGFCPVGTMKELDNFAKLMIFVIIAFYVSMFLAWSQYDHPYSFVTNNISRLGRPSWNPNGYPYFMVGVIGSSIMLAIYYRSLHRWKTGQADLDRLADILIYIGYLSCIALTLIAIINADHKLGHKIVGGAYFISDMLLMSVACLFIWRHPLLDKGMVVLCILSAALDAVYILSNAKASWAEWATVACSFGVAFWFSMNSRRLTLERNNKPTDTRIT